MSFPQYPKYKDSGVEWLGNVPAHWNPTKLKHLGEAQIGLTYDPAEIVDEADGTLVLRSSNVQDGMIVFDDNVFVKKTIPTQLTTRLGDILICSRNGSRALIGKNAMIAEDAAGITFGAFMTIYRSATNDFLYWVFNSQLFAQQSSSFLTSTINQLTIGNLNSFDVLLPPREEQLIIAAFLDRETAKIDGLVGEQRRLIELLKEKRQAVISHAVTKGLNPHAPMKPSGIEWLGDVPEHWETPPLYLRYDAVLGKMLDEKRLTRKHSLPYIRNVDVQWDWVNTDELPELDITPDEIERFTLKRGDILICEGGEVGRTAIWRGVIEQCAYQKAIHRLRPLSENEDGRFFFYCMCFAAATEVFLAQGNPNTIPHLTGEKLRRYRFPTPPINEQIAIAAFLDRESDKLDALTAEAQRAIDLLQERRTALISAAVTGKIDVRGLANGGRMSLHTEINFESDFCNHLAEHGWLHAEGDAANYDRARALFPEDVLAWVQETQPKAWETLVKNHGASAGETLLNRLRASLDKSGTLDVLRHGIDLLGLRERMMMAQFKPALAINPDILTRYGANRLRIVRQVRYSLHNENCIDLVLFLNGVPVATVEVKTDFTQSVGDAMDQYRFDRNPRPKGQSAEPLLSFPNGALVHFAVSNMEVAMTTKLEGPATQFLPFNQGDGRGKGNPVNPAGGHRTAYLWEQVWERGSALEILGRYLVAQRDKKKQIQKIIFPRFHQLAATRKLLAAVLHEGPGGKYLIQHSAGSGKTNSIAWSAHFLADLHDANNKKLFDSVLVISDRNVIDTQLQEAIFDFERTTGVVATIKGEGGSKSAELAEALSGDKKIVVCTIQTFPYALAKVRELAAAHGKRFAVIADEAHSSQSGEAAAKLKAVLSPEELKDFADGGEVSMDDVLAAQMAERAQDVGITFVAFTATPKTKTMELFGTRPDPKRKPASDNVPEPFHVYSMRQAIEEGFILDVLQNYLTYKLAFKLAHEGVAIDEKEVERSAALKKIMNWVKLHPYNIAQKVEIVVEHFRQYVAPLLKGQGKAMVVVGSRVEAVRWKLAIDKYIRDRGYGICTLVAFSSDVSDKESGSDPFSETSPTMNPNLRGRSIREAFNTEEYQILLVANKFQTGFDQPLLCGMYVDRRLAGVQAVQTLSRLNRAHPGKDTTYVLDFVNSAGEVLAAFKTYYETATLADTTDPNLVLNLRNKLDAAGHYDDFEIERVVAVELKLEAKQSELVAALEPVVDRLLRKYKAAQEQLAAGRAQEDKAAIEAADNEMKALLLFKSDMGAYLRLYIFLSQIFDYGNTAIEKRAIFYKRLLPLLDFGREREGIDLSKVVLTHHNLKGQGRRTMTLGGGENPKLAPIAESGGGEVQEKEKALLNEIIQKVNDLFDGELTDQDKLVYVNNVIKGKLLESETLKQQANNNTKEQFANSPDLKNELMNAIIGALEAHTAMSTQALGSETVRSGLKDVLLGPARLYESLREQVGGDVIEK